MHTKYELSSRAPFSILVIILMLTAPKSFGTPGGLFETTTPDTFSGESLRTQIEQPLQLLRQLYSLKHPKAPQWAPPDFEKQHTTYDTYEDVHGDLAARAALRAIKGSEASRPFSKTVKNVDWTAVERDKKNYSEAYELAVERFKRWKMSDERKIEIENTSKRLEIELPAFLKSLADTNPEAYSTVMAEYGKYRGVYSVWYSDYDAYMNALEVLSAKQGK